MELPIFHGKNCVMSFDELLKKLSKSSKYLQRYQNIVFFLDLILPVFLYTNRPTFHQIYIYHNNYRRYLDNYQALFNHTHFIRPGQQKDFEKITAALRATAVLGPTAAEASSRLAPRLPLQKSVSTPSIVAAVQPPQPQPVNM